MYKYVTCVYMCVCVSLQMVNFSVENVTFVYPESSVNIYLNVTASNNFSSSSSTNVSSSTTCFHTNLFGGIIHRKSLHMHVGTLQPIMADPDTFQSLH